jgi:hypothetical protein
LPTRFDLHDRTYHRIGTGQAGIAVAAAVIVRAAQVLVEETDQLIEVNRSDGLAIRRELEEQFRTLHNRAQVLLGICGVLLTASVLITTGRILGRGNFPLERAAGWLLALAGLCDIASTAIIVGGVLHIRWLTKVDDGGLRGWTMRAIAHRDRKTRTYHVALGVILLSMLFYQAAVLIVVLRL